MFAPSPDSLVKEMCSNFKIPPQEPITFAPRWKEEMVCTMDGNAFVIEMTIGIYTVYLPTLAK